KDRGVTVHDVNPASAAYNTGISVPVPHGFPFSDVAVTSDSGFAYATGSEGVLCRINLQSSVICPTGPVINQGSFALTPDGTTLLMGGATSTSLRLVDTSLLLVILEVPMEGVVGGRYRVVAITCDGTRAR